MSTSRGLSYTLGRILGEHPGKVVLGLAVFLVLMYSSIWYSGREEAAERERVEQQRAVAARAAREAKQAADLKTSAALAAKCGPDFPPIALQAATLVKQQKATDALNLVKGCDIASSPIQTKEFVQATAKAAALEAEKIAARRAIERDAAAKKAERELKAERRKHGVSVGMTMDEVRDSSWGKPRDINRTIGSGYQHEQWVYGGGYLYFRNGVLTTIQN